MAACQVSIQQFFWSLTHCTRCKVIQYLFIITVTHWPTDFFIFKYNLLKVTVLPVKRVLLNMSQGKNDFQQGGRENSLQLKIIMRIEKRKYNQWKKDIITKKIILKQCKKQKYIWKILHQKLHIRKKSIRKILRCNWYIKKQTPWKSRK